MMTRAGQNELQRNSQCLYSDLYCTECDNFIPKCKNIAGGRASAAEALPLTQQEKFIRLHPPDPLGEDGRGEKEEHGRRGVES